MIHVILIAGLSIGAPFYHKSSPPPPPLIENNNFKFVGSWKMRWSNGSGDVVFSQDIINGERKNTGSFWCLWSGNQQWVGSWRVEIVKNKLKLFVVEGKVPKRPDSVPENPIYWDVDLDNTQLAGPCHYRSGMIYFRLHKMK